MGKFCFRKTAGYVVLSIAGVMIFMLLIPTGILSAAIDLLWQGAGRLADRMD